MTPPPLPVHYSRTQAAAYTRDHPDALPPGAISTESAVHDPSRVPVVPVHGTNGRASTDWFTLAPLLANAGRPVFAFSWRRARPRPERSVTGTHVMPATGRPWTVRKVVGLAPTYAGTTANGLARHLDLPVASRIRRFLDDKMPSWREQLPGSDVLSRLESAPAEDEHVDYTSIVTRFDRVVTPYAASFTALPQARRIVLQAHDPRARVGHLGILHHPLALARTLAALTEQPARAATAATRR